MDELEQFKIICKKCGEEAKYETESPPNCECCSGGGTVTIKCECGEEESVYV